jgi:hypothetical protein
VLSLVVPQLTGASTELLEGAFSFAVLAVLMPAIVILYVFVIAAIVHALLLLFSGGGSGFEATFRVVCFSYGSTAPLMIVPVVGSLAAGIWVLIASIFGLIEVHETSGVKATLAVLLPLALCCLCICGVVAAAIGLGLGIRG